MKNFIAIAGVSLAIFLLSVSLASAQFKSGFNIPGCISMSGDKEDGYAIINLSCTREGTGKLRILYHGYDQITKRGDLEILFEGGCTDCYVQSRRLDIEGRSLGTWTTLASGNKNAVHKLDQADYELRIKFGSVEWSQPAYLHVGPSMDNLVKSVLQSFDLALGALSDKPSHRSVKLLRNSKPISSMRHLNHGKMTLRNLDSGLADHTVEGTYRYCEYEILNAAGQRDTSVSPSAILAAYKALSESMQGSVHLETSRRLIFSLHDALGETWVKLWASVGYYTLEVVDN
jgi:hypothetical protein